MTMLTPEFHTYADKPTALISGSYTTVRGGELREIDSMLSQQGDNVPASGFENRFARVEDGTRKTAYVEDCLSFLQAVDYVEISAQDVVSRFNEQVFPGLAFEARLLAHLRLQTGRSRHLTYLSTVLARLDERRVTPERLVEAVQEDTGEDYSDELSWNIEKIRFWANLLDTLGALSYTTGGPRTEIVTSPTRALLAELIAYYAEHADDGSSAVGLFEWIDEWALPVLSERAGTPTLTVGVADTLRSMEEDGAIRTVRLTDSQSVVDVPVKGNRMRTISKVHIEDLPSSAAYSYPLSRTSRRVTQ